MFSLLECGSIPAVTSLFSRVVCIKAVDAFRALLYSLSLYDSVCNSVSVTVQRPDKHLLSPPSSPLPLSLRLCEKFKMFLNTFLSSTP